MATILKFIIAGESVQAERSFSRFADSVNKVNTAMAANRAVMKDSQVQMIRTGVLVSDLRDRVAALDRQLASQRELDIKDKGAKASLASLQVQASRLQDTLQRENIDSRGAARLEAQLLGLEAQADRLNDKMSGGRGGFFGRAAGGALGGLLGNAGPVAGAAAAAPVLGVLAISAVQAAGALVAAGAGLAAFAGLSFPTISDLTTALGSLSTATDNYRQASLNLNQAIHQSPADWKLYQATIHGLEPDFQNAAKLLTNQNAQWQDLSPNMQKSVVALANNKTAYDKLLPSQKTALGALLNQKAAWDTLNPQQQTAARLVGKLGGEFGRLAKKLEPVTFKVFDEGLKVANDLLPSFLPLAKTAGGALDGLLKALDRAVKSPPGIKPVGPMGGKLAAVSGPLPPLTGFQQFVSDLQALSGPAITALGTGMGKIAGAVGNLILAAASPNSIKVLSDLLGLLATAINILAWAIKRASGNIQKWKDILHQTASKFDEFRHDAMVFFHDVAHIFDKGRHEVAHIWDLMWNNTVGRAERGMHDIAGEFDTWRHNIAHIWDVIWNNTVGRAERGVTDVVNAVKNLPGDIKQIFNGALTWLLQAGKDVIQGLWNGMLAIWHKVTSFISGIANWIKQHKGPVSLDAHLLEPAGRSLMSGLLRGLVGGFGGIAHFIGGVAGKIASALGLGGGGGTSGVQGIAARLLSSFGWGQNQMPPLIALWNQESGWRWNATNPTSGAYGIPQALPASKMAAAGADWRTNPITQILWGLGYIRSVYGSPAAAWAHEQAVNWYAHGGVIPETVLGIGQSGRRYVFGEKGPETVTPGVHAPSSARTEALLGQLLAELRATPVKTGRALADGLNGATRSAYYAGIYGTR